MSSFAGIIGFPRLSEYCRLSGLAIFDQAPFRIWGIKVADKTANVAWTRFISACNYKRYMSNLQKRI